MILRLPCLLFNLQNRKCQKVQVILLCSMVEACQRTGSVFYLESVLFTHSSNQITSFSGGHGMSVEIILHSNGYHWQIFDRKTCGEMLSSFLSWILNILLEVIYHQNVWRSVIVTFHIFNIFEYLTMSLQTWLQSARRDVLDNQNVFEQYILQGMLHLPVFK